MKVSELIAKLQAMPQDLPVVIEDADTDWLLHIWMVEAREDCVVIGGDYDERLRPLPRG